MYTGDVEANRARQVVDEAAVNVEIEVHRRSGQQGEATTADRALLPLSCRPGIAADFAPQNQPVVHPRAGSKHQFASLSDAVEGNR